MIKRLKRKYTLIVMLSFISVISIIITAINLVSYSAVNSQLDEKLEMIIDNEGKMPDFPLPDIFGDAETPDDAPEDEPADDGGEGVTKPEEAPDEETAPDEGVTEENPADEEEKSDSNEEEKREEEVEDPRQNMSPETPFETRFFSVKLNTDGTFASVDTTKIAAVDDELAMQYTLSVLEGGMRNL